MVDTYNRFKGKGLEFVAVAMNYDPPMYVANYAQKRQLPFKVALDDGSVEAAMATLPTEQREILHLVCVEEMSYAETARILDIPLGTVMSRLSRARLALSEKLGIR